jgi:DNA-binding MarR family transcriptional regulator
MPDLPLVRLLSMAVTVGLEELHEELSRRGHPDLRPSHGYALNAVLNGRDTASQLAPVLGMTKQGVAKLVRTLVENGYLEQADSQPGDARTKPFVLSARGREAVALSVEIQEDIDARWAALVGTRRMATTRAVLEEAVRSAGDGELPAIRLAW